LTNQSVNINRRVAEIEENSRIDEGKDPQGDTRSRG